MVSSASATALPGSTTAWLVYCVVAALTVGGANARITMVVLVGVPMLGDAASAPLLHVTTPPVALQTKPPDPAARGAAATLRNLDPAGRLSTTVTLLTGSLPQLLTVSV